MGAGEVGVGSGVGAGGAVSPLELVGVGAPSAKSDSLLSESAPAAREIEEPEDGAAAALVSNALFVPSPTKSMRFVEV